MSEDDSNPLFETASVSYGASPLQQLLLLQAKDLMLRRWLSFLDQQEGSGGKLKASRSLKAAIRVLYEELRPRIKSKQKKGYEYSTEVMDGLVEKSPEELMRLLLEYLELDLKLTQIDTKQEYKSMSVWRKQGGFDV